MSSIDHLYEDGGEAWAVDSDHSDYPQIGSPLPPNPCTLSNSQGMFEIRAPDTVLRYCLAVHPVRRSAIYGKY